jgi:hypothetical protein
MASTVSTLTSFPGQFSIPPACFYNVQGLAGWLNNNPAYKLNFSETGAFPFLFPPSYSTLFMEYGVYDPTKVPLCADIQTLSQYQALKYKTQIQLFQKIYSINSNAYINYVSTGQGPQYYTFSTFNEKYEYNTAIPLINKLYPFKAMADAPGLNWQIPFPIGM